MIQTPEVSGEGSKGGQDPSLQGPLNLEVKRLPRCHTLPLFLQVQSLLRLAIRGSISGEDICRWKLWIEHVSLRCIAGFGDFWI